MSTSSLIQALPEAWRSTNGLAIVGSIGIHALLMAVLPFTSLDPQNVDLPSSIGVVQLSPEEQSRVPQVAADPSVISSANTAQQQAPASSQGFQSEILPPLPAPPPFLPPPPGTTPMYQLPSDGSLPVPKPIPLPPPPQNSSVLSQNPFSQTPQPNQNTQAPPANAVPPVPGLPPTQGLQPSPLPVPPNFNPQVGGSGRQAQPTPATDRELMARRNALLQRLAAANRSKADNSPTGDRERLLDAAAQQQVQRAKEREERASRLATALQQRRQATPTPTPSPATPPQAERASRLAAALQQRRQAIPPAPNPPVVTPKDDRTVRIAALQQRLARPIGARPNSKPQSEAAQTTAQIAALQQQYQKMEQIYPYFITATPIRKRVPVCNKRLNGNEAIVAALIDPAGKIVVGPDIISQDSPSPVRKAAIRYVKRYRFTKSANAIHQAFRLRFDHTPTLCPKK